MSDKKKKIQVQKESVSPRRPVILKSDRENTKEQTKDKLDKEKQPTILIKPREVSKEECQQNAKTTSIESEAVQPSKIVQNEQKERKEQKVKYMSKSVKLLDEYLEFNNTALDFLSDSSTSYLVVGVIGMQAVGKSMVMNLISLEKYDEDICRRILNSYEKFSEGLSNVESEKQIENFTYDSVEVKELQKDFIFQMEHLDQIERGVHCTKGVDMYVSKERVILLDCQPLWSSCLLDESTVPGPGHTANSTTVDCLQVASFLMAVCHVVIAVQDWFVDHNFIRYLQTAEMLMPTISVSSTNASQDTQESDSPRQISPHLLLLHNRCQLEDFLPETVKVMQEFYRKAFQRSSLQLCSGLSMYSELNADTSLDLDQIAKSRDKKSCEPPVNLFLLPEIYDDYDNKEIYRGHLPFEQMARRLRWMVLSASRHQISNVSNLSEKGWLHYCNKAWETIRKCNFFIEYERFLP